MSSSSLSNTGDEVSGDVLDKIFLLLPADSLIRFRFVCKYWFSLITSNINDPRFVQMHTHVHHQHPSHATTTTDNNLPTIFCPSITPFGNHHLYSLNIITSSSCKNKKSTDAIEIVYPFKSPSSQLEILGSCIGLLCIRVLDKKDDASSKRNRYDEKIVYTKDIICLWNPSTTEFKHVPATPIEKLYNDVGVKVMYGFGYDRLIDDYKLVRLVGFSSELYGRNFNKSEVKVYTLGTNSWKRVDKEMPYSYKQLLPNVGLFVNGAIHWLSQDYNRIFTFDIEDEEFREVPIPECSKEVMFRATLQELRGCLCIFNPYHGPNEARFEVWMMKEYGVKESWTKLFRATNPDNTISWSLRPLWIHKNGDVLIGNNNAGVLFPEHLVIYDPNNNEVESICCSQEIPFNWRKALVHIGSLVSLKSGTYVGQEQQLKQEEVIENIDNKSLIFCRLDLNWW